MQQMQAPIQEILTEMCLQKQYRQEHVGLAHRLVEIESNLDGHIVSTTITHPYPTLAQDHCIPTTKTPFKMELVRWLRSIGLDLQN